MQFSIFFLEKEVTTFLFLLKLSIVFVSEKLSFILFLFLFTDFFDVNFNEFYEFFNNYKFFNNFWALSKSFFDCFYGFFDNVFLLQFYSFWALLSIFYFGLRIYNYKVWLSNAFCFGKENYLFEGLVFWILLNFLSDVGAMLA